MIRIEASPKNGRVDIRHAEFDTEIIEYGNGAAKLLATCNSKDAKRIMEALNMASLQEYVEQTVATTLRKARAQVPSTATPDVADRLRPRRDV
jgi:hypothetical protein